MLIWDGSCSFKGAVLQQRKETPIFHCSLNKYETSGFGYKNPDEAPCHGYVIRSMLASTKLCKEPFPFPAALACVMRRIVPSHWVLEVAVLEDGLEDYIKPQYPISMVPNGKLHKVLNWELKTLLDGEGSTPASQSPRA